MIFKPSFIEGGLYILQTADASHALYTAQREALPMKYSTESKTECVCVCVCVQHTLLANFDIFPFRQLFLTGEINSLSQEYNVGLQLLFDSQ